LDVPWPISEALDILDDVKPIKKPPTDDDGELIKRLYHSVDYKRYGKDSSDANIHVLTSPNDRSALAEAFIRVLPNYVTRRLSADIASRWFTSSAIHAADDIVLLLDDEGNWNGQWQTAMDLEDLAMLEMQGITVDLSNLSQPPHDPDRLMLGAAEDVSVRSFGTVFGRNDRPVAGDATAQSVASDAPAESSGAAGQAGGSKPD
jgi:hypothetical protein